MKTIIQAEEANLINKCSIWNSAVLSGVLAVLILGLLLNLLGASIGFSLFSPSRGALYSLSVGAIIWLLFSSVSSMYVGGWVASYFGRGKSNQEGALYGMLVGSISILVWLALTFSALGTVISSSLSGLQHAISALNSTVVEGTTLVNKALKGASKISPELSEKVKKAMPDLKPVIDQINQQVSELLPAETDLTDAGNKEISSEKIKSKLEKLIVKYLESNGESNNKDIRKKLSNLLVEATGKPETEINEKIDEWQKVYIEAKEKAQKAATDLSKDIAKKASQFALLNFFILASSMIASIIGGIYGIRRR